MSHLADLAFTSQSIPLGLRRALTLLLFVAMLGLESAAAQVSLVHNWTKGACNQKLTYSRDGSTLLLGGGQTLSSVRVSDGKVIGTVYTNWINTTYPFPLNNGSGMVYMAGDGSSIRRYDFTSRVSSVVRSEIAPYTLGYNNVQAVSADGALLAYAAFNSSNSRYYLVLANFSTGAFVARVSMAASESINGLAFASGDTRIIAWTNKGLRGFNATTLAATGTRNSTTMDSFIVSPDGTKVFARDASKMASINASDLTQNWFLASALDAWYGVSSDNTKVIGRSYNTVLGGFYIRAYAVSNGALLANTFNSEANNNYTTGAVSPTSSQVLTYETNPSTRVEAWSFDAAFAGTRLPDLMEGQVYGNFESQIESTRGGSPSQSAVALVDGVGHRSVRSASTGQELFNAEIGPSHTSPDGLYYGKIGYNAASQYGLHVYRMSDNSIVASVLDDTASTFGWAGSGRLVLSRTTNFGLRVFNFNGSSLALQTTITDADQQDFYPTSADGTKILLKHHLVVAYQVHDLTTGASLGTLDFTDTLSGLLQAGFVANGQLWIHDWKYDGSIATYFNRVRFFDTTQATLPVTKTISIPTTDGTDYGGAAVSLDGATVAIGFMTAGVYPEGFQPSILRVYRVADGALLSENQDHIPGYQAGIVISDDARSLVWSARITGTISGFEMPVVLNSVTVAPSAVVGGNSVTGTVTLSRTAPIGGTVVTLTAGAALSVPVSVTVPAGSATAAFTVGTAGVDSTVTQAVNATFDGFTTSTNVTVTPVSALGISFLPSTVTGGSSSTGTVLLNGKAGPSGLVVALSSNSANVVVPASVSVVAQSASASFTATTTDPAATLTATVSGTSGAISGSGLLTVNSTGGLLTSFDVAAIKGGNALVLTLTIGIVAPAGGYTYTLSSSDPAIAPPASITIPAGARTLVVGIKTNPVLADLLATLTATKDGFSKTASATIQAPIVKSVAASHTSVVGDTTVTAIILLDGPAPTGLSVAASSSSAFITVPASINIPAGQFYGVAILTCKKSTSPRTITVTIAGKQVKVFLRTNP